MPQSNLGWFLWLWAFQMNWKTFVTLIQKLCAWAPCPFLACLAWHLCTSVLWDFMPNLAIFVWWCRKAFSCSAVRRSETDDFGSCRYWKLWGRWCFKPSASCKIWLQNLRVSTAFKRSVVFLCVNLLHPSLKEAKNKYYDFFPRPLIISLGHRLKHEQATTAQISHLSWLSIFFYAVIQ